MLGYVVGDLIHEPLEALAAMLLPELLQLADVAVGQRLGLGPAGVEVIFVLVPPHLHHTDVVLTEDQTECEGDPALFCSMRVSWVAAYS